jgi:hypothetical protein
MSTALWLVSSVKEEPDTVPNFSVSVPEPTVEVDAA